MFSRPVFAANSLSVVFPRVPRIRRLTNELEDRLADLYGEPQSIPVPDELDPQVPRIVFQSSGGHSQILISQVSISLNVTYDGEWTTNADKRHDYLRERVPLVYDLCAAAKAEPLFSGLTTRVRSSSDRSDQEILNHVVKVLAIAEAGSRLSELSLRLSSVVDSRFFDNVTIQSHREWAPDAEASVPRLPSSAATSRGIELVQDFNDRYAFNERPEYGTSVAVGVEVVARSQESLHAWIARVTEAGFS